MSLTVPVPVPAAAESSAKTFRLTLVRLGSFRISSLCCCYRDKDGAQINVLIVAAGAGGGRRLTLIRRIVHCVRPVVCSSCACVCVSVSVCIVARTPANHRGDNGCNCGDPQAWFRFFRFGYKLLFSLSFFALSANASPCPTLRFSFSLSLRLFLSLFALFCSTVGYYFKWFSAIKGLPSLLL